MLHNVIYMTELRKVRKVGGSLTLTIPLTTGFEFDDWVKFENDGKRVILTKVVI